MLIIDIEIDKNFNVNPWATQSLSKVAWDLYLVPDSKVICNKTMTPRFNESTLHFQKYLNVLEISGTLIYCSTRSKVFGSRVIRRS
jgi:hypothetical protein